MIWGRPGPEQSIKIPKTWACSSSAVYYLWKTLGRQAVQASASLICQMRSLNKMISKSFPIHTSYDCLQKRIPVLVANQVCSEALQAFLNKALGNCQLLYLIPPFSHAHTTLLIIVICMFNNWKEGRCAQKIKMKKPEVLESWSFHIRFLHVMVILYHCYISFSYFV